MSLVSVLKTNSHLCFMFDFFPVVIHGGVRECKHKIFLHLCTLNSIRTEIFTTFGSNSINQVRLVFYL